ncbi:MAG: hypothetical protein JRD89_02085 [Deltaproteobacteria bacterium]|nr:hypothetical protein [Deltaproteobacteria bacterium]
MAYANAVQIGPDFFAKAKNDYADWRWALVREFMQNCIDCGSKLIDITIGSAPATVENGAVVSGDTVLVVKNDGKPMTEDVLVNKLLSLGASGKDFVGTVGGFGKAKEILYFCHQEYQIHSGSLLVVGKGAGYDLSSVEFLHGTESVITIEGDCIIELCSAAAKFASECQWKGELRVNGEPLKTNLKKGKRRRDLGWAVVYTNKTFPGRLIVRIDGMPMFSRYVSHDRCVVVEVDRSSGEALTSNRDGLTWEYRQKLDAFVEQLVVDKVSALRDHPKTTYHHFDGERQQCASTAVMQDLVSAAYATMPKPPVADPAEGETLSVDQQVGYDDNPSFAETAIRMERGRCGYEFIVKNNTNLTVPDHFLPFYFSAYSSKLVSVWIKCLLELHELFGHKDSFAVGFLLDDIREAECEVTEEYGRVYYINPAVIVEQVCSRSRSLKKRWLFNNAGKYQLLAVAVHEFVHGFGYGVHDEGYANQMTNMVGTAFANKKRFHHCFR